MERKSLFVVLFIIPVFILVAAAAPGDVITFEAKKGTVTFKHAEHQKRLGADTCNKCHHTAKPDGSDVKKCSECHGAENVEKDGKTIPSMKNAVHKTCKDCHKAEAKGPTKCEECHAKPEGAATTG